MEINGNQEEAGYFDAELKSLQKGIETLLEASP